MVNARLPVSLGQVYSEHIPTFAATSEVLTIHRAGMYSITGTDTILADRILVPMLQTEHSKIHQSELLFNHLRIVLGAYRLATPGIDEVKEPRQEIL